MTEPVLGPVLDLDAIQAKWLAVCPSCDAGIGGACSHPDEDYRPVMAGLLAEVRRLSSELAGVRVELERTEGDWAVAIREASRARAALTRVAEYVKDDFTPPDGDGERFGRLLSPRAIRERLGPFALSVAATDTEETP